MIAALTDDIEELECEKTLLLNQFDVTGDHDMAEFKLRIASMETSWEKLDRQEQKYSVDLDKALTEYGSLIEQAAGMDAVEVDAARQTIRLDKERETIHRLQDTYGKRFDSGMLTQGRKEVAKMLNEAAEPVSIRQKLQHPYEQPGKQHHTSEHHQER